MIRTTCLTLCLTFGLGQMLPTGLSTGAAFAGVTEEAQAAAVELQEAVAALEAATAAKDRVAALSQTIRAYEKGQASLRSALRQADLREDELTRRFAAKQDRLTRLIGTLSALEPEMGPLLLLHPGGPLGTVRSGMLMADMTPALQAEVDVVRADLEELRQLRDLQLAAGQTLQTGLERATDARSALSQAISDRTDLPKRFTEDPDVLLGLLESADTLDAFAQGLNLDDRQISGFADSKGALVLPAFGRIILTPGETDARGVTRPGLTLATRPVALVTAPWGGTIRYLGPLLDYGNVIVLEPGDGYLLIFGGLEEVYGEVGDIVGQNAPLGLMGGAETDDTTSDLAQTGNLTGASRTETLYLELRQGAQPVDPRDWFALTGE
jgi:septal ring factor EnvC (AmiA/AmiB activator)